MQLQIPITFDSVLFPSLHMKIMKYSPCMGSYDFSRTFGVVRNHKSDSTGLSQRSKQQYSNEGGVASSRCQSRLICTGYYSIQYWKGSSRHSISTPTQRWPYVWYVRLIKCICNLLSKMFVGCRLTVVYVTGIPAFLPTALASL